jgi:hypothetical protein
MSYLFRLLPNSDAMLSKETSSARIHIIDASTSAVQVMLLRNPFCTGALVMPDDFFNSLYHLFVMLLVDRPLPNFDAILAKETLSLIMLSIFASTSAVHLASRSDAYAAAFATR